MAVRIGVIVGAVAVVARTPDLKPGILAVMALGNSSCDAGIGPWGLLYHSCSCIHMLSSVHSLGSSGQGGLISTNLIAQSPSP